MRRPSRIDGLLVGTHLAPLLLRAPSLSMGGIPGHQPVCFDLHLQGARQRVLKFVRPRPVTPYRGSLTSAWLVSRLVDPLRHRWLEVVGVEDVDRLWGLWTRVAEEVLLALSCPESTWGTSTRMCVLKKSREGHSLLQNAVSVWQTRGHQHKLPGLSVEARRVQRILNTVAAVSCGFDRSIVECTTETQSTALNRTRELGRHEGVGVSEGRKGLILNDPPPSWMSLPKVATP